MKTALSNERKLPSVFENAYPGTKNLATFVDKKILVILRDGKKLIGILRTYDQYGNIILHDTTERIYIGQDYGDQDCGIYLIRGENVSIFGEYDTSVPLTGLTQKPMTEMLTKQRQLIDENRRIAKLKRQIHRDFGLLEADIIADFDI